MKRAFQRIVILVTLSMCLQATQAAENIDNNIITLLRNKNFSKLETELNTFQENYLADVKNEHNLNTAFNAFYRANPSYESIYNEWIKKFPNSANAFLARGIYFTAMGGSSRGTKYRSDTSKSQIDGMKIFYTKAFNDLEKAKELNSKLLPIYVYEMTLQIVDGNKANVLALKNSALKTHPYSFSIRSAYLWSLQPRWGGSMEKIENEITTIKPLYGKNPLLKTLDDYTSAELGEQALLAQKYQSAVELFTKALRNGENTWYYSQRGEAYSNLKMRDEALQDLEKSLSLDPNQPHTLSIAAFNYANQFNLLKAIEYLDRSLDAEPNDEWNVHMRGAYNLNAGRYKEALSDFTKAIELNPSSKEYIQHRDLALQAVQSTQPH